MIYTKGSDGAQAYTKTASASAPSRKVKAIDTRRGRCFLRLLPVSAFRDGVTVDTLTDLSAETLEKHLLFSNRYCGYSVLGNGAIASSMQRQSSSRSI